MLTEYLTLFWFAVLGNEYKLNVSIRKSSKMQNLGNLGSPFAMSRTDAQNGVEIIFKCSLKLNTFLPKNSSTYYKYSYFEMQ